MQPKFSNRALIFIFIGAILAVAFVYALRDIVFPFAVAALLAYLLSPLVGRMQSAGVRRSVAVTMLFLCFVAVLGVSLYLILPPLVDETISFNRNLPAYVTSTKYAAMDVQGKIERRYPLIRERRLIDRGVARLQDLMQEEIGKIPAFIMGLFSLFSLLVLIPVLTLFMLISGDDLLDNIVELMPARYVETVLAMFYEADLVLGRFIRGQIIETAAVGMMTISGLLVLDVNYAVLIGVIAGFANMVPYLGPAVGLILAVIVAAIQYQSAVMMVKVIIMFAVIQFIDGHAIQPIVIGGGVNLSPVAMIFSLMVGAKLFGIMGMIFAVPTAAVLKVIGGILLRKPPLASEADGTCPPL